MGKGRSQNNQVAQELGNTCNMGFPLRHKALVTHVGFKLLAAGPYNDKKILFVTHEGMQHYMFYIMQFRFVETSKIS
jgi:hypothetical protein